MSRLKFVLVDSSYCDFLRKSDPCVPYTMDKKLNRPFVGVLLQMGSMSYYAPLSSPKPKHLTMKNQIDMIKVNGGQYGVINLNNMIPVHINLITMVDTVVSLDDSPSEVKYKALLSNQLTWCNANKDAIISKAQKLYSIIISNSGWDSLLKRCCDFSGNEFKLRQYCGEKGWEI